MSVCVCMLLMYKDLTGVVALLLLMMMGEERLRGHVHLSTGSLQTPGVSAPNDVTSLVLPHRDKGRAEGGGSVCVCVFVPV